MAMITRALAATPGVRHEVCVTAQHREMLDSVLRLFEIEPDFDLDVMAPDQELTAVTNAVLDGMRTVLVETRPDWVLVQGDTTTALAASLAAFYAKIPVGHVEAGLRTGDLSSPWPEEMNRRLTDVLSERHYAPTEQARQNILAEGFPDSGIVVTGNTVIDTLLYTVSRLRREPELDGDCGAALRGLDANRRLILVTAHRRESFGIGFEQICRALRELGSRDDVEIVYPVHPNSRVREPAYRHLRDHPHIRLLQPLGYMAFVHLMDKAHFILTDSGGIQEEAPSLGKPVLVMRDVTERPEAVRAGTARLIGTDAERIAREAARLLDSEEAYTAMARVDNPYGDGHASERIVEDLVGA